MEAFCINFGGFEASELGMLSGDEGWQCYVYLKLRAGFPLVRIFYTAVTHSGNPYSNYTLYHLRTGVRVKRTMGEKQAYLIVSKGFQFSLLV